MLCQKLNSSILFQLEPKSNSETQPKRSIRPMGRKSFRDCSVIPNDDDGRVYVRQTTWPWGRLVDVPNRPLRVGTAERYPVSLSHPWTNGSDLARCPVRQAKPLIHV